MFQISFRSLVFLIDPNFKKMVNIFRNIRPFIGTNLYKHQRYDLRCKRVRGCTWLSKLSRNFQNKLKLWMYEGNQYLKIQFSSIWFLIQNWLPTPKYWAWVTYNSEFLPFYLKNDEYPILIEINVHTFSISPHHYISQWEPLLIKKHFMLISWVCARDCALRERVCDFLRVRGLRAR